MVQRSRLAVSALLSIALAGGTVALTQSPAWAGGNGATTFTFHVHGTTAFGEFPAITFLPGGTGPALPTGCWLTGAHEVIVPTDGNGVFHGTANKTGFWFTATYTGAASVFPIVYTGTTPVFVTNPTTPTTTSVAYTAGTPPLATGRLTVWFGGADNLKNGVSHATITFTGTAATGMAVGVSGHFDVTVNANGVTTAMPVGLTCS